MGRAGILKSIYGCLAILFRIQSKNAWKSQGISAK
jgi:hypothetical protein